ncbi:MAG: hypothetical protein R3B09_10490 [Nannocystaceae bacterium]
MTTSRTYRLNASSEQLMQRLDEVVRGRRVERVGKDEQLQLVPDGDGDGFKILLGSGEPDDPAAYVQGKLSEHAGQVLLEVQPGLVGIRPDGTRAASRELLEWALAVGGFLAIVLIAGRLTGEYAIATIGRWLALYLGLVTYRFTRRALRRRRDRAELLSLVESAAGPLAALPEAGPFREAALPGDVESGSER